MLVVAGVAVANRPEPCRASWSGCRVSGRTSAPTPQRFAVDVAALVGIEFHADSIVLNEQSVFAHDVIERQLAHKETDAVRAAYNRAQYLDQRRVLSQNVERPIESM